MSGYLSRLLLSTLLVTWVVSSLVFLIIHLVPGDPVAVMLGEWASPADEAALRAQLGLDQPLWVQYVHYFGSLLRLDLGQSLYFEQPVSQILVERIPLTTY